MDISGHINKIQTELEARSKALDLRESRIIEKETKIHERTEELEGIMAKYEIETEEIKKRRQELSVIEQRIFTSEQLVQERRLAELDKISAQKTLKEAQELKAEVGQKEKELARRETELSKEKETYKEKIERELARKVFGSVYA